MDEGMRGLFSQVEGLAEAMDHDLRNRQPERASQVAALYMFAKGYKSFQAARFLFDHGFWQDAATICRTLLELGFQARWANQNPEIGAGRPPTQQLAQRAMNRGGTLFSSDRGWRPLRPRTAS